MAIKICPECGGKVSTSRNVCIHCGYVFPATKTCPDCGESCPLETRECPGCGYLFDDVAEKAASEGTAAQKDDGQNSFRVSGGVLLSYSGNESEVRIPDGVLSIGNGAFKGNLAVTKVIFSDSVTSIGDEAFFGCANLKEIENYFNIASFGRSAFEGAGLFEVEIGPSVVSLGECCFSAMKSLEKLVYKPNKVLKLKNTFCNCPKLADIEMDQDYFLFILAKTGSAPKFKGESRPTLGDAFRDTAYAEKFRSSVHEGICPKCGGPLKSTFSGPVCESCDILYFEGLRPWSQREDEKPAENAEPTPAPVAAPSGETVSNEEASLSCPYCHSGELMEIGKGFYLCLTCKMRFLDIQGGSAGASATYAPQAEAKPAVETSSETNEADSLVEPEIPPVEPVETDEGKYEKALSLKEQRKYGSAEKAFTSLGEFKDSTVQAEECRKLAKEIADKEKYDKALSFKEAKDYAFAEKVFASLGEFKDSRAQAEECRRLAKEAADEETYQAALTLAAKQGSAKEMLEAYEEAIEKLEGIPGYKDADKLKEEYKEKLKPLQEEVAKKKAAFRKKVRKIAIISSASVALVTAVLLTTFLYIVPETRQNSIIDALNAKNYDAAWSLIQANGNYGDHEGLYYMQFAGRYFEAGDYESGIDYVVDWADGDVDVAYDADGGTCKSSETIRSAKHINNDPKKPGYTFSGWSLAFYSLDSRAHHASLSLKATYDVDTYSITYVLNGGTNNSSNPTSYTVESSDITLLPATRTGYAFAGWSNGSSIVSTIKKGTYGNLTLTAQWTPVSYKISYDLQGGSIEGQKDSYTVEEAVTLPNPTREGYTFLGWTGPGLSIPQKDYEQPKGSYGDKSYKANWQAIEYSITYVLDGGTNNDGNPTSYTIESSDITLLPATKEEYSFVGWSDGSSIISTIKKGTYGNLTLTAQWEVITYQVSYDLGGGSMDEATSSYSINDSFSLSDPTRAGYTFLGWTGSNGDSPEKGVSIPKGTTGDKSYKANWEAITYGITYVLNGGANDERNPSEYTPDSSDITLHPATREHYTFVGWSDGSSIVSTIKQGSYGNLTLTALWEATAYTISYELDGGTNSSSNPTTYTIETQDITLDDASKPGYTFLGWYADLSFETQVSSIPAGSHGNITLYAKFSAVSYSITYDLDGGTQEGNPTELNVESAPIALSAPTRVGYEFLGWTGSNGETPETNVVIPTGTIGSLHYKANWKTIEYKITYDLAGGTNSSSNPNTYTIEDSVTLASPTKTGCTFLGWYEGSSKVTSISKGTTGDITLTAKWKATSYSITYYLNGGTNDSSNPSKYTAESDDINLAAPSREGYTFKGWYSDSSFETPVETIPSGSTGIVKLYAKWEANKNTLSVVSEDESKGSVSFSGEGYTDEKITVTATVAAGHAFKGWYRNGTLMSRNNPYTFSMPAGDCSLIAEFWTKDENLGIVPSTALEEGIITYGLYPQKRINDSATLASLNALESAESNGWYLLNGEYYAKKSANPYRSNYTFDDGTKIASGTEYWFKCEPITWKVLSSENGEYSLVSTVLLDAHRYDGSSNSYENSEVRTWLNETFYSSAFSLGNSCIQTTTVDNSAATTDSNPNKYACDNTEDSVYLLSYQDYLNADYGFSTSSGSSATRECKTTDWARANRAYYYTSSPYLYNGRYWTRSPRSSNSTNAWSVDNLGSLSQGYTVTSYSFSVRPAITIKIA